MRKLQARLRQAYLRARLAFNNWRYDRIDDSVVRARGRQDHVACRIDECEGELFKLYAEAAWLTPQR